MKNERKRERPRHYTVVDGESRAKQSFKDECDINNIMRKYEKTGLISHMNRHSGTYQNVPEEPDYQSALETVIKAQEMFAELPAVTRRHFENNPAKFLEFVGDPANAEKWDEVGLRNPNLAGTSGEPSDGAKQSEGPPQGKEKSAPTQPSEKGDKDTK